ncbi:hypothetical protein L208DRAFT_1109553, partial [Tricholoma matsutake]
LNDSPNGVAEVDKTHVKPTVQKCHTQWKAIVTKMKQKELADRNKNIPVNKSSIKAAVDPNENNVKVYQVYLTKDFKAKSKAAQSLIETTVKNFILNTEQERAFRIIANHAVGPKTEQLTMYLGGMGGTGKSEVIK